MPRILKRPAAKGDLVDHFDYLEEHGSIRIANRFLFAAGQTMEILAQFPFSGTPQETKRTELAGMRKKRIKGFLNHLIFYFPLSDGIDVVRIIHAARDLERLFEEEFI
jgi:toxin ParE1/3/4